jgi:hypothetical protein
VNCRTAKSTPYPRTAGSVTHIARLSRWLPCSSTHPVIRQRAASRTTIERSKPFPKNLGDDVKDDAVYLQSCRAKRNAAEYDAANEASETECTELIEFAKKFRTTVRAWLRKSIARKPRS